MSTKYGPYQLRPPSRHRRPAWLRSRGAQGDIVGIVLADLYESTLAEPLPPDLVRLVERLRT